MLRNLSVATTFATFCFAALSGCAESKFKGSNTNASTSVPTQTDAKPDCKPKQKHDTNILLMLDGSQSQLVSDPDNVRGSGALDFVDRLIAKASSEESAKYKYQVAVARFDTDAVRGSGWVKVSSTNRPTLASDIASATANPNGFTNYHGALTLAYEIFRELGSSDDKAVAARNFLVFLTDGEPTVPKENPTGEIAADITRLVSSVNASIVTVAVGETVTPAGEVLLKDMAKSADGSGEFMAARTAPELLPVWRSIEAKISGGCEK